MSRFLFTISATLLMACSFSAHAFDYKEHQNQGVWTNDAGEKLHVTDKGVKEYLAINNNDFCYGSYSLGRDFTTGQELNNSVVDGMNYGYELLAEAKQDPNHSFDIPAILGNIDTAKKVLNLIDNQKRYETFEMACGDAYHTLILLKPNQLFEKIFMSGDVFKLYQK